MKTDYVANVDALALLQSLPDGSVNCVVTSPPYYGLRDYGVDGQIGLEDTPQEFIGKLIAVFTEVHRVLRKDGVVWVNLGDSYAGNSNSGGATPRVGGGVPYRIEKLPKKQTSLDSKQLMMIPARFAIAMQDAGWILRSECVWVKPNPMPESVTDRPTKSHEMVYLFAKSQKYWFDADAIREPFETADPNSVSYRRNGKSDSRHNAPIETMAKQMPDSGMWQPTGLGRNRRDVFTIATEPNSFAHFATFPQALVEPLILAGCPEKVCAVCGSPYMREVEATGGTIGKSWVNHDEDSERGLTRHGSSQTMKDGSYRRIDKGIHATCKCSADTHAGIVLDPFMGSGTVALVARRLGRHYVGSELNAEYAALAETRLQHTSKEELAAALSGKPVTRPLWEP